MDEEEIVAPAEETSEAEKAPESDPILDSLKDDSEIVPEITPAKKTEGTEEVEEEAEDEDKNLKSEQDDDQEKGKEGEEDLDPKEKARRGYEERQKVKAERQTRVSEQTKDYIESAENDTDKRLRTMEVQEYNRIIESTEDKLISENDRVKANPDLQMFNPDSKEFNPELHKYAMENFIEGKIELDSNGNMVGLKGSLYQHLNRTAELYRGAIKSGRFQQVRDQRKTKTNSEPKMAASPKEETSKDPLMEVLMSD